MEILSLVSSIVLFFSIGSLTAVLFLYLHLVKKLLSQVGSLLEMVTWYQEWYKTVHSPEETTGLEKQEFIHHMNHFSEEGKKVPLILEDGPIERKGDC
jgi:hypothetical protein